ncbi:MAG: SUMF1/EgtB/PvdO family nonheme iron enzyme [Lentimicrobiaceae bacterium]|nr:SUMF1/EgtB/PvdO family nonheme iron enzyme [Lentimicrobiaceae bacterium]
MKNQIILFFALMVTTMLSANNITVSNLSLIGQNTTDDYSMVKFDISWENSWHISSVANNWDAAWVFVKYHISEFNGGDGFWKHAWLNNTGNTAPSGSVIDIGLLTPGTFFNATTNPGLGAFIYRNADGTGTFSLTNVKLRWNYGANGVDDNAVIDIQIYAIEMVYVPQGTFVLGSGGGEVNHFYKSPISTDTYSINTEATITVGTSENTLYYETGPYNLGGDQSGPIPAAFPKGYNAFYCMKYEISQQGYVDFLNSLTQTQATARKYDKPTDNYRYEIMGSTVGSYATANPYVACNWLNYADVAAYLDWSGLRLMTELEFEKACRGTISAVNNEFAWGSTSITQSTGITNSGLTNEVSMNNGNCATSNQTFVQGPMRVGVFATDSSTREHAGATYYGIMEMSGNVWERAVTVGNAIGRAFDGTHGDGVLDEAGNANVSTWPTYSGVGFRGGAWDTGAYTFSPVSSRFYMNYGEIIRVNDNGGRGVRTAP